MNEEFNLKKKKLASMFEKHINNIHINGLENIPNTGTNLFVVNHSCFLDVYLIAHVLNMPCISMVSSNSLFGSNEERKHKLNEMLYPYPIETRANKQYKDIIFKGAIKILENKNNIIIFPQGVFDNSGKISKARIGVVKILFNTLDSKREKYNIIPIALNTSNININNIQSSSVWDDFEATISILPPFDYNSYYNKYKKCLLDDDKKVIFHNLIDAIMKKIAKTLNIEYVDEYISLYDMDGFWFPNGEYITFEKSENELLYNKYKNLIDSIVDKYCSKS